MNTMNWIEYNAVRGKKIGQFFIIQWKFIIDLGNLSYICKNQAFL